MKNMNTMTLLAAGTCAMIAASAANAEVYYSTNFGTGYTTGALVPGTIQANSAGQNEWKQTGENPSTPIQVTNGAAIIGTSGQDVYHACNPVNPTAGHTLYYSASMQVTAAQSTGDFFLFVGDPAGTSTNFFGRLFAKSTTGGFLLGIQANGGGSSAPVTYGTLPLTLSQTYNVVVAYDFATGALNDTFAVYVDPNSTNRASLTSYASAVWFGTSPAEPTQLTEIGLRQGTSSTAPSVSVYSLAAGSSLADVGVIPAPGALALLGVAGLVGSRRRR